MKKIAIPLLLLAVIGTLLAVLYIKLGQINSDVDSLSVTSSSGTDGIVVDLAASAESDVVTAAVNSEILEIVSNDVVVAVNNIFSVDATGEDETEDEFMNRLGLVMSGNCMRGSSPYITAWAQQAFSSQLLCSGSFVIDDTKTTFENGYSCFYGTITLKVGFLTSEIDSGFFGETITKSGEYTYNLKVSFGSDGLVEKIEVV